MGQRVMQEEIGETTPSFWVSISGILSSHEIADIFYTFQNDISTYDDIVSEFMGRFNANPDPEWVVNHQWNMICRLINNEIFAAEDYDDNESL
jgi:hypothetical protein